MSPRLVTAESIAAREQQLIAIARELIEAAGIPALTIDSLVAASPYSKGTIYNHFAGKEDLMVAICHECERELLEFFQRAAQFEGSSRERIMVIMLSYLIWARSHPTQLLAVLSSRSPTVVECASKYRLAQHEASESELLATVIKVIQQGISQDELVQPSDMSLPQMTFALWSSGFGVLALLANRVQRDERKTLIVEREYFNNISLMLDGLSWQPVSQAWDYRTSLKRATETLFSGEVYELAERGIKLELHK